MFLGETSLSPHLDMLENFNQKINVRAKSAKTLLGSTY